MVSILLLESSRIFLNHVLNHDCLIWDVGLAANLIENRNLWRWNVGLARLLLLLTWALRSSDCPWRWACARSVHDAQTNNSHFRRDAVLIRLLWYMRARTHAWLWHKCSDKAALTTYSCIWYEIRALAEGLRVASDVALRHVFCFRRAALARPACCFRTRSQGLSVASERSLEACVSLQRCGSKRDLRFVFVTQP